MGSFPHEYSGYRHVSDDATRVLFEKDWGVALDPEPGLRIPNMFDAAIDTASWACSCRARTSRNPIPTPST